MKIESDKDREYFNSRVKKRLFKAICTSPLKHPDMLINPESINAIVENITKEFENGT